MTNAANQTYISILEKFFERVDSETLFDSNDSTYFRRLRNEICDALIQLLIWQRSFLEAEKGLDWPYEGFRKRIFFSKNRPGRIPIRLFKSRPACFWRGCPFPGSGGGWRRPRIILDPILKSKRY